MEISANWNDAIGRMTTREVATDPNTSGDLFETKEKKGG